MLSGQADAEAQRRTALLDQLEQQQQRRRFETALEAEQQKLRQLELQEEKEVPARPYAPAVHYFPFCCLLAHSSPFIPTRVSKRARARSRCCFGFFVVARSTARALHLTPPARRQLNAMLSRLEEDRALSRKMELDVKMKLQAWARPPRATLDLPPPTRTRRRRRPSARADVCIHPQEAQEKVAFHTVLKEAEERIVGRRTLRHTRTPWTDGLTRRSRGARAVPAVAAADWREADPGGERHDQAVSARRAPGVWGGSPESDPTQLPAPWVGLVHCADTRT